MMGVWSEVLYCIVEVQGRVVLSEGIGWFEGVRTVAV